MTLYTIGYGGRSPSGLVEALQQAGVKVLADVRDYPRSRIAGFNKGPLERTLGLQGIRYVHIPQLGNPNRKTPGAPPALNDAKTGLPILMELLQSADPLPGPGQDVAIMCACRRWEGCHRRLVVAEALKVAPNLEVNHLP